MFEWITRLTGRRSHTWPRLSSAEVRKRSRVLVIDDAEFPYLPLLKNDGYTVEKWNDVMDLSKLEEGAYDLVLLDIHGVGSSQSKDEGLGILRHLKAVAPAQAIIAYSSADFSLKYKEFFDLADSTLPKEADYVQFKKAIDAVLQRRFTLDFYVDRVLATTGASVSDSTRLREVTAAAILEREPEELRDFLSRADVDEKVIDRALQIAQVAIGVLQLATALG